VPGRTPKVRPDTPSKSVEGRLAPSNPDHHFTEGAAFLIVISVACRLEIQYPVNHWLDPVGIDSGGHLFQHHAAPDEYSVQTRALEHQRVRVGIPLGACEEADQAYASPIAKGTH
jgi:hypothetical protein